MADPASSAPNCSNSAGKFCCKRSQIAETDRDSDKISRLPDEVLCHILSYLPTKDVVRTTILSKQWSKVWTFLPNIEIDDCSYWKRNISPEAKSRFMNFVDRILRLTDLQKLSLRCSRNYDCSLLSQWMSAADDVPHLPSLKILHLHFVHFRKDESMKNLIDGCPVLEELYIMIDDDDEYSKHMKLFRRPSSLKSLRVDSQYVCYNDIQLRINSLERERGYIKDDSVAVQYDVNSFSSLLNRCRHSSTREGTDDDSGLLELISKLSNTKYLFVSHDILKCLLECTRSDDLPMFLNLTHLVLQACDNYSWTDLPYSLESSSNSLESSSNIITFVSRKVEYREQMRLQSQGPEWLMQNLEKIVLADFRGCRDELEIVRYFLKSATILEKMSIKFYYSGLKNKDILQKLLRFPRSSAKCEIFCL